MPVLAVCTVAHVHGFVDFIDGKVSVAVVIDADMEANATIDAKLARVLDEGLNEGGLAVHTVRSVATVGAISTVRSVSTIGPVHAVHAIKAVGAVLAREALRPCLAGSTVVSINAVADAASQRHERNEEGEKHRSGSVHGEASPCGMITMPPFNWRPMSGPFGNGPQTTGASVDHSAVGLCQSRN